MASNLTPLVGTYPTRKGEPQVGDLVTVRVYNPKSGEFDLVTGAHLTRMAHSNAWVKLAGLTVPEPYRIGDRLVIGTDQVVDW